MARAAADTPVVQTRWYAERARRHLRDAGGGDPFRDQAVGAIAPSIAGRDSMNVAAVIAEILKREGVTFLIGYPVNPIIEAAAAADIRTIIVRQERTGLHMADAVSRVSSSDRIGVFAMQHGPGTENAVGGVAQAYADSSP